MAHNDPDLVHDGDNLVRVRQGETSLGQVRQQQHRSGLHDWGAVPSMQSMVSGPHSFYAQDPTAPRHTQKASRSAQTQPGGLSAQRKDDTNPAASKQSSAPAPTPVTTPWIPPEGMPTTASRTQVTGAPFLSWAGLRQRMRDIDPSSRPDESFGWSMAQYFSTQQGGADPASLLRSIEKNLRRSDKRLRNITFMLRDVQLNPATYSFDVLTQLNNFSAVLHKMNHDGLAWFLSASCPVEEITEGLSAALFGSNLDTVGFETALVSWWRHRMGWSNHPSGQRQHLPLNTELFGIKEVIAIALMYNPDAASVYTETSPENIGYDSLARNMLRYLQEYEEDMPKQDSGKGGFRQLSRSTQLQELTNLIVTQTASSRGTEFRLVGLQMPEASWPETAGTTEEDDNERDSTIERRPVDMSQAVAVAQSTGQHSTTDGRFTIEDDEEEQEDAFLGEDSGLVEQDGKEAELEERQAEQPAPISHYPAFRLEEGGSAVGYRTTPVGDRPFTRTEAMAEIDRTMGENTYLSQHLKTIINDPELYTESYRVLSTQTLGDLVALLIELDIWNFVNKETDVAAKTRVLNAHLEQMRGHERSQTFFGDTWEEVLDNIASNLRYRLMPEISREADEAAEALVAAAKAQREEEESQHIVGRTADV